MTTIPFVNEVSDTDSSPFYDYTNDIIYVGDDDGYLHKFTGVFKGSPSEVTNSSNPWATVVGGAMLTSPVLDSGVSPPLVFVASVYTGSVGGKLSAVNTSTASPTTSMLLGHNINYDITDAPVVDSTAGYVYVAVSNDGATNAHSSVFIFPRALSNNPNNGSEAAIGTAASSANLPPVYDGDFDNTYYNSSNATGNLYICGDAGGEPTLYQVHISAGTFPSGNVKTGPTLASTAGTACSPVTEIYNANATNGPFDWIFLSVEGSGSMTPCSSGGCVMNFIVTAWQASSAYLLNQEILDSNLNIQKVTTAGTSGSSQPSWNATSGGTTNDGSVVVWTNQGSMAANAASRAATGGTSGIIIDNTASSTGASQVYFSTLSNGTCGTSSGVGCAVQASQAGLQ